MTFLLGVLLGAAPSFVAGLVWLATRPTGAPSIDAAREFEGR